MSKNYYAILKVSLINVDKIDYDALVKSVEKCLSFFNAESKERYKKSIILSINLLAEKNVLTQEIIDTLLSKKIFQNEIVDEAVRTLSEINLLSSDMLLKVLNARGTILELCEALLLLESFAKNNSHLLDKEQLKAVRKDIIDNENHFAPSLAKGIILLISNKLYELKNYLLRASSGRTQDVAQQMVELKKQGLLSDDTLELLVAQTHSFSKFTHMLMRFKKAGLLENALILLSTKRALFFVYAPLMQRLHENGLWDRVDDLMSCKFPTDFVVDVELKSKLSSCTMSVDVSDHDAYLQVPLDEKDHHEDTSLFVSRSPSR